MQLSERDQLIVDNIPLVYYTLHKHFPRWAFDEDMQQIGMIGLCKAADNYDPEKGKFSTVAVVYIRNEIINEFESRMSQKRTCEKSSLNFEFDDDNTLEDHLCCEHDIDFCDREGLFKALSPKERMVAELLEQGYSQAEISRKTGEHKANVHFWVKRIKKKWRNFI